MMDVLLLLNVRVRERLADPDMIQDHVKLEGDKIYRFEERNINNNDTENLQ